MKGHGRRVGIQQHRGLWEGNFAPVVAGIIPRLSPPLDPGSEV